LVLEYLFFLFVFIDGLRDGHHSGIPSLFDVVSSCGKHTYECFPIVLELLIKAPARGPVCRIQPLAGLRGLGFLEKFDLGNDYGTLFKAVGPEELAGDATKFNERSDGLLYQLLMWLDFHSKSRLSLASTHFICNSHSASSCSISSCTS
jgi:hypothetical protein